MNIDQLTKFMGTYAYSTPKKVAITEFVELTEKKVKGGANSLCGPKSSNICAIVFTKEDDSETLLDKLKPIIELSEQDPVSFVYIKSEKEPFIH